MPSLNETPTAERVHIGIFGKRNAGKSSVINAITGQNLAIVSETKGTTTDPVYKAMELLPIGPVVFIDTPGLDDEGELGQKRIAKAYQVLNKSDIALLVVDAREGLRDEDYAIITEFAFKKIKFLIVFNKCDLVKDFKPKVPEDLEDNYVCVSANTKENIDALKEKLATIIPQNDMTLKIVGDLLKPNDLAVLVVPIDSAAPKGRLILPQQQTIRAILELGAVSVVARETELAATLKSLGTKPKMVITDSQAFEKVAKIVPTDILLTSFSILFARYKGNLQLAVKSVTTLDSIKDGDKILIAEGCTHHRQCDDIGTKKLPNWIRNYTKKNPLFSFTSGGEFPRDLAEYKLVIHCGACMLNEREMQARIKKACDQNIPITNYGITIAYMHGILKRSLEPFKDIHKLLE